MADHALRTRTLGIIAGEGVFPILVARGARAAGVRTVCCGLSGSVWPAVRAEVDVFAPVGLLRLGQWVRVLRRYACDETIMVGRVQKQQAYNYLNFLRFRPDLRTLRLVTRVLLKDKRDQSLLGAIADTLWAEGFPLADSTKYCPEHLATAGVMTPARPPADRQWADLRHGYTLARTLSRLQIGQALAISDLNVVAVEALEGTDRMIERAGQLCRRGGWTLIKVSNTHDDMRFDVPTIGVQTIDKLAAAGAGCLVLTPGKVMMIDKPAVLARAVEKRICVVGYDPEPSTDVPVIGAEKGSLC